MSSTEENQIQKICECLSILTGDVSIETPPDQQDSVDIKESFSLELKRNLHATFKRIDSYPELKSYIEGFIEPCTGEKCESCDYLKFLQLCLVLIKLLHAALIDDMENYKNDLGIPTGILSISQQNILKRCLQFTVALGILPNLLRGIGVPLSKRLRHAIILERFTSESTLCQKHVQLAVCLETLMSCVESEAMQSIILPYHATDLLAGLLQVCHAPIKKINIKEANPGQSAHSDATAHSESEIITMMLEHRKFFQNHLDLFLKKICPSLLMWELLLFQGIPMRIDPGDKIERIPTWLQKICNQMLTDLILQNHGIADLVQVVLDKVYDGDLESGNIDAIKLEAVARLVTYNPVKHMTLPDYMAKISKQVFQLLHLKGSLVDNLLKYVATCIIFQFCERDIKSAEEFLLVKLLKPLWSCVRAPNNPQAKVIVSEKDLTTCLEDLHHIFVSFSNPLSRKYLKILYLFSHCLCNMFFFLLKTQSYLKDKAKGLIHNILQNSSDEDALSLLHAVSFSNNKHCRAYLTKVSFATGDEGGIVAVPKVEEDFADEIVRYHAILDVLSELQNKNLNRSYILLVLKEFCTFHLESKDSIMDPENIKSGILFNALLQELSEWNVDIGEALMSNISEVIDILMTLLDSICNCRSDAAFYEKTLWVVLMILNSILESDDQLTASDWTSLKKCLPSLQKLQKSNIDSDLKEIIFSIIIHIATNGAACKNGIEIMKEFMAHLPDNPTPNMKLTEQRMLDIVEKFERGCDISGASGGGAAPRKKAAKGAKYAAAAAAAAASGSKRQGDKCAKAKKSESYSRTTKCEEKKKPSVFDLAMRDIKNPSIPMKGHGLVSLKNLLQARDPEALAHKKQLLKLLQENIRHDDSYVYLAAIQALALLGEIDAELVLPVILDHYQKVDEKVDLRLKCGEVLLKICNSLGEMIYKYQDQLLHTYLIGTKHEDSQIRSSSLSNLGQACVCLKFNISSHWLQEILLCVLSYLKSDRDIEVRRCAIMVIYLLLKGVGNNMFKVLEYEMKMIYAQVKISYTRENDEVLRLHAQHALEEINAIMNEIFSTKPPIQKEIRILQ